MASTRMESSHGTLTHTIQKVGWGVGGIKGVCGKV